MAFFRSESERVVTVITFTSSGSGSRLTAALGLGSGSGSGLGAGFAGLEGAERAALVVITGWSRLPSSILKVSAALISGMRCFGASRILRVRLSFSRRTLTVLPLSFMFLGPGRMCLSLRE